MSFNKDAAAVKGVFLVNGSIFLQLPLKKLFYLKNPPYHTKIGFFME